MHHDERGIARDPLGRFRGNVRGTTIQLHGRVTRIGGARRCHVSVARRLHGRRIDVQHHLVAVAGVPAIEVCVERALGQQAERVRTALCRRQLVADLSPGWRLRGLLD